MKRENLSTGTCCVIATALAGAMAGGALAGEDDTSIDDLRAEIARLEQRVAQFENQNGDKWMTEQRAAEIRSLVQDVLTDADSRSSLLQGGSTAGWDNGFFLSSADGNFRLNIKGQMQTRYVFNNQDEDSSADSSRGGFEVTRSKLSFTGHVGDPSWMDLLQGNFDRSGGTYFLEDAYIGHAFGNGWVVLAGQVKVPMVREWLIDDFQQLTVERSLISNEFDAGRTQGVAIDYRNENFHFTGGYTDGHIATGGFNMPALTRDTEYSFTGRVEFLFSGDWSQFDDMTSFTGDETGFMVGGALHYQDGEYGTVADEIEAFQWTVDAWAEFGGANLGGYIVGRHLESSTIDLDQYGVVLQGGFFLNEDWELYGRYEWGDDDTTGSDDLNVFTVGFNRYFAQNNVKWSTDLGFAFDSVASTWGSGFLGRGGDIAGWRTDGSDDDGQIVFRTQLQLQF